MDPFGEPHPDAPPELSRFAFLIGNWRCDAKVRINGGEWQTFPAEWRGIIEAHRSED
jgi:hypothetical protein